jgi:Ca-activated chloride channel family protein
VVAPTRPREELTDVLPDLTFEAPGRLWVLAALAAAAAAVLLLARRRRAGREQYAEPALLASVAPHRLGWRRPVTAGLLALALGAMTAAFAQPSIAGEQPRERAVVMVAIDTSTSMLLTDVAPDRITVAKDAAQDFISELPAEVEVGLVAYNATAELVAAPTSDHEVVAAAVEGLTLTGGTAAGDGLLLSLEAIVDALGPAADEPEPAGRIVQLADGDSTAGTSLEEAAATVAAARVPVSTIAFGTPDATTVVDGVETPVGADLSALRQVAETTGGRSYDAASASELREVYDDIGSALVPEPGREDVSDLFAGLGLALLFATAVPSLLWSSRLV